MWNCTHFRHPTDEQLQHVDIYIFSDLDDLQSVYFELDILQLEELHVLLGKMQIMYSGSYIST